MHSTLLGIAAGLSNEDLLQRVRLLACRERDATVELVAHLAELDTRKLHVAQGYSSLFGYCTEALHLAEHAAYNRIEAARVSRKFPVILDRLADGSLNLSTVRLLAPHLTSENHLSVLAEATRKSKRGVEALVAQLCPRPDVSASIRRLPPPRQPSLEPDTLAAPVAPTAAPAALVTAPVAFPTGPQPAPTLGTGPRHCRGPHRIRKRSAEPFRCGSFPGSGHRCSTRRAARDTSEPPRDRSPCARALPSAVHRRSTNPREPASRSGPAAP